MSGSPQALRRIARFFATLAWPLWTASTILLAWELSIDLFDVRPFIITKPSAIGARILADFTSGEIFTHFFITGQEVLIGIALAAFFGIALGTLIGLSGLAERMFYPIILVVQTIPKVAIAPLLIIWLGYGINSKIVTAALLAFFPVLVNVIAGIKTVDARRITLMRMLCASPTQVFFKVRLPNMLTYLFAGLEVGVVLALIGAIVGEFVGASQGLGSLLIQRQAAIDVSGVFSAVAYLSFMGLSLTLLIKFIRRQVVFWY